MTSMRLVRYRTTDLTRLALVTRIVDQVIRGEMGVSAADAALTEAVAAPHPYPRWVATAGWGGLAASVALLLGGAPVIWVAAFVVTAFIDRIGRLLGRWGVASFFLHLIGGFTATVATLGLFSLGVMPPGTESSLVIAAGITVLLSGLSVVGTVQDAISGRVVTAAGRAVEIALLSAGLLAGVILGLRLAAWFGISLNAAVPVAADLSRFGISASAAAAAAALSALACYAPLRSLVAAALAGAIGWSAYAALTLLAHLGPVVTTDLAAVLVGLLTEVIGRRTTMHRQVIILSGIIPLLPGLHRVPGLLPAGVRADAGRGRRPGRPHPRPGDRPRPRGRCDARPVHRPAPTRAGRRGAGCQAHPSSTAEVSVGGLTVPQTRVLCLINAWGSRARPAWASHGVTSAGRTDCCSCSRPGVRRAGGDGTYA
jgi:uncharacterized membrane protein YjjP (DUF1212 family)